MRSEDSRAFGPVPLADVIGRAHVDVDQRPIRRWELGPAHLTPMRPAVDLHPRRHLDRQRAIRSTRVPATLDSA